VENRVKIECGLPHKAPCHLSGGLEDCRDDNRCEICWRYELDSKETPSSHGVQFEEDEDTDEDEPQVGDFSFGTGDQS